MKKFNIPDVNTPNYWDSHQTAFDFGLRQQEYKKLAGEGRAIVELGCGLSPFLSKCDFVDKWGVDFSEQTIVKAKEMYKGISYVCESATATSFAKKYFDVSVAGELIEHLKEPIDLIKEMVRITNRRIIISTPKLEFIDPEHLWEFSLTDLRRLLKPYGKVNAYEIKSERFKGRSYLFATCDL